MDALASFVLAHPQFTLCAGCLFIVSWGGMAGYFVGRLVSWAMEPYRED